MNSQSTTQTDHDRRRFQRLNHQGTVKVYTEGDDPAGVFTLGSADVSPAGLFIQSDYLFSVGEWMDLEFTTPGKPFAMRRWGKIVRVSTSSDDPGPGMAVAIHPPPF